VPLQSEPAPPAPPAGSEVAAVAPPRPVVDREALLARYMRSLAELIGRERVYPPQARLRGWEGAVTLRLRLDADGALRDAAVARSSGREVLDRQALAMVQGVDAWPQPPEALRSGEAFSVLMPVVFRLED
jgi:protein TonB